MLLNYNDMKHTFKVGDGMTTENSTAEERMEVLQLLRDYDYPVSDCLTKNTQVKKLELVFTDVCEETEWHSTWGCTTNPLTYQQMKNYIQPTMNTTQAIELLKKGELQIEITDLFEVIMFASKNRLFPQFSYFNNNNYAYFDGDFMRGRRNPLQYVRVIKLCDIVDYEPKTPSLTIKKIDKSEFNNSFFIDTNDANKTLSDAFKGLDESLKGVLKEVDELVQKIDELTVKPISLEVGKWYKSSNYLICYVGNGKCYGFDLSNEEWFNDLPHSEYNHKYGNYQPATTAEVTEALTKEAVKRGLTIDCLPYIKCINGYNKNTTWRLKNSLWILNGGFLDCCIFENGKWATVVETISLKDAEKELGKKIIV